MLGKPGREGLLLTRLQIGKLRLGGRQGEPRVPLLFLSHSRPHSTPTLYWTPPLFGLPTWLREVPGGLGTESLQAGHTHTGEQ